MLWSMAAMMMALWGIAMASSYSFGGYVHVLPLGAIGVVAFRLAQERRGRSIEPHP
jgi:hypothetical protein